MVAPAEESELTRGDERWMRAALEEADAGAAEGEVPVGCVLVNAGDEVVARAHNLRERASDPTAHAEILALREAATRARGWRLDGTTAYVTLEPCVMCAGAFVHARVRRVVYGCDDPKAGALVSLYGIGEDARLNHRFEVVGRVLAEDCAARLQTFFAKLRAQGKK
jgi:tRNA(adenine34) deaminase